MIEGVSIHVFARMMGVSRPAVRRWLRLGYITRRPDGLIDAEIAAESLRAWGLPRHASQPGAAGECRMTLAEAMALPSSPAAEAAVAAVLRPADE